MLIRKMPIALACAAVFVSIGVQPAAAESCSDRMPECLRANLQGGGAATDALTKRCKQEVAACQTRCKAGQKYYVGTMSGKHYPVTSCN